MPNLLRGEAGHGVKGEAFPGKRRKEFFLKKPFLVFFEAADALLDGGELGPDVHAGDVANGGGGSVQGVKTSDPDLEKLIEIGSGDGEEFNTVQDGEVGTQGFVENALVEFEPGEFAVDVGRLHESGFK